MQSRAGISMTIAVVVAYQDTIPKCPVRFLGVVGGLFCHLGSLLRGLCFFSRGYVRAYVEGCLVHDCVKALTSISKKHRSKMLLFHMIDGLGAHMMSLYRCLETSLTIVFAWKLRTRRWDARTAVDKQV